MKRKLPRMILVCTGGTLCATVVRPLLAVADWRQTNNANKHEVDQVVNDILRLITKLKRLATIMELKKIIYYQAFFCAHSNGNVC